MPFLSGTLLLHVQPHVTPTTGPCVHLADAVSLAPSCQKPLSSPSYPPKCPHGDQASLTLLQNSQQLDTPGTQRELTESWCVPLRETHGGPYLGAGTVLRPG